VQNFTQTSNFGAVILTKAFLLNSENIWQNSRVSELGSPNLEQLLLRVTKQ
jgi:hypothetical protein